MEPGDHSPWPTSGTIGGASHIQTPSRAEHGREGVFICSLVPADSRGRVLAQSQSQVSPGSGKGQHTNHMMTDPHKWGAGTGVQSSRRDPGVVPRCPIAVAAAGSVGIGEAVPIRSS